MNGKCNIGHHEIIKHMRLAFYRKLPQFYRREAHAGEAVLVGTGPSVERNVGEIKALAKAGAAIFAIKGAHDWLLSHGIRPHFAVAVDGQEKIADLYKNPQQDITYLIASQCHPKTFDALKKNRVVVWNCYTKKAHEYWAKWLKKKKRKDKIFFVQGGSTSGMRCITMAYLMGFRRLNIFGFDSCLSVPEEHQKTLDEAVASGNHVQIDIPRELQKLKITGENNPKELLVAVVEGHAFFCDPAMALQGNEFLPQITAMNDCQVRVYGEGFIPTAAKYAALRGDPRFVMPGEDWGRLDHPDRGSIKTEPVEVPIVAPPPTEVVA